ncbi:MAG: hypothetical protein K5987_02785 [Lachnospiraceae bacterium]|nr:hypothetical protein [Lachnospiraceae bacterium]
MGSFRRMCNGISDKFKTVFAAVLACFTALNLKFESLASAGEATASAESEQTMLLLLIMGGMLIIILSVVVSVVSSVVSSVASAVDDEDSEE